MRRFTIEISHDAYSALYQVALRQHRSPKQQAAVIVEQAVLGDAPLYEERTPRLTELGNGTARAVPEGEGAEA